MELTAESLQQVKFGAKVRGYDPEEVDRFIANVTEVGEELHERLRRATERAAAADQQLATIAANPPAESHTNQSAELGRVWERAVSAAEGAIEEARQEAHRILDDARRTSDEAVGNARRDAERLAEEAQAQLRAEIVRLETARDQLKSDVDGLSSFLGGEKSRVRATIAKALADIDEYGSVNDSAPVLSQVDIPPRPYSAPAPAYSQPDPEPAPYAAPQAQSRFEPEPAYQEPAFQEPVAQEPKYQEAQYQEPEPAWAGDQPNEAPRDQFQDQQPAAEEDEGDPFLAELRRAVRDDGPLGPRDDANEEDSIDRLYASEEDDKSFFKRKK